ncbi:MAG: carbohydrate kinase family protein [Anaerolineae bacterium]|nr:carbohydrate kinase family protein [Anaerolineae bacterium]
MDIVVTGSIAYDYLMRFPGSFREHIMADALEQVSLSFLVEDMTKHWGGVAANIAFNMAKLGLNPRLMGTVGRDFPDYRKWLESVGVDTSTVQQHDDVFTASFFCNTDEENNQISSFYSGAMTKARNYALTELSGNIAPDLVIISPNDPAAMTNLSNDCRERGLRFIYDPSQQIARMDGATLQHDMQGAYLMVINQYESNMVMKKTGMSMDDLQNSVDLLVITHGAEGSEIYTNGDLLKVEAFPPSEILDPTGAGDAYRAGFITGLAYDLPLSLCGSVGSLCATYVLEHIGTQHHTYTISEFIERFRSRYNDDGALDVLLKSSIGE